MASTRKKVAVGAGVVSLLAIGALVPWFWASLRGLLSGSPITSRVSTSSKPVDFETLRLASASMYGYWREVDSIVDDEGRWTGSAFVVASASFHGVDCLILATNSHCIGIADLGEHATDGEAEVGDYEINVQFATGRVARALYVGEIRESLDLGLIAVPSTGLVRGRDYQLVSLGDIHEPKIGEKVIAVGDPGGVVRGAMTTGVVNRFHSNLLCCGYDFIEFDADTYFGNSGGPLYVQEDGSFRLMGINTAVSFDSSRRSFAIPARALADNISEFKWFRADAGGAAAALRDIYDFKAIVDE